MQAKIIIYEHSQNGISLFVTPETDAERILLRGLWKHGKLELCNGVADNSGQGFSVHWRFMEEKAREE